MINLKTQIDDVHVALTPYQNLADAIILQAVKDFRRTKSSKTQDSITKFFKSEWFELLSNANSEYLIKKLEDELVQNQHSNT